MRGQPKKQLISSSFALEEEDVNRNYVEVRVIDI
jgi:hypothetical protein